MPRLICCGIALWLLVPLQSSPGLVFERPVLGASLFRAAWAYRHDRPWLESQLEHLAKYGFTAIRAFGVVGDPEAPDYWDGREIDWRWDDYDRVIAGVTDLAADRYGIRVQWTIFADAQKNTPPDERARVVDRFIAMSRGRESKILAFEVANEHAQNGFGGSAGVAQLRQLARHLRDSTTVPVAASAHTPELCPLYAAGDVDFATIHFDRAAAHSVWSPLTRPWREARRRGQCSSCDLPETASNNEPLGVGSSIASNVDPTALVMSAVNTYVAGLPIYMLHTGPGVRDDPSHPEGLRPSGLNELPQARALFAGFAAIRRYLPEDVLEWRPMTASDPDFPFRVEGRTAITLGVRRGTDFLVTAAGLSGNVSLVARWPLSVRAIDPLSGESLVEGRLEEGESLALSGRAGIAAGKIGK